MSILFNDQKVHLVGKLTSNSMLLRNIRKQFYQRINYLLMFYLFKLKKNMINYRRAFKMRSTFKLFIGTITCCILIMLGAFTHLLEKDLNEYSSSMIDLNFELQIDIQNLKPNENIDLKFNDVNHLDFTFLSESKNTCNQKDVLSPYLVILVKSKYSNFANREAIRNTWAQSGSDYPIRTVFLIGSPPKSENLGNKQKYLDLIFDENKKNGDIVQQDFIDSYYNNTLKSLMAIKWINTYCSNSKYYLLIDDDFFLSNTSNVCIFLGFKN